MRRLRGHPAGLLALLLALTVQAFAPDWVTLVMRATATSAYPPADICHAEGSGTNRQDDRPGSPQPVHQPPCPVCQAFAAVQTLLGCAAAPFLAPFLSRYRLRRLPTRLAPHRSPDIRPRARAPPCS